MDTAQRKQNPAHGKVFPFRELNGSLIYVQQPAQQHTSAAKRVLGYVIGSKSLGIVSTNTPEVQYTGKLTVNGFCDSDWGNDPDTRKSVTGYVHCIAGGTISWASRRQSIVAQSTAEAEYVAASEACMEGQGLRNLLIEEFSHIDTEYRLGIDNQAAFVMSTNPTYRCRTRHIELRWHYVRDQVAEWTVEL
ncbi:unnamed protein product [Peronospora belbahrii]|uniref:Reverse transcriptase Ty1/copia-type domain-containing protein n=1 Tax=Peronospora belbahrii TaxID=622444 RepID=A0AAU9LBX1_9STRA|nr:unnamed protein product [Peronospora belbahrii]